MAPAVAAPLALRRVLELVGDSCEAVCGSECNPPARDSRVGDNGGGADVTQRAPPWCRGDELRRGARGSCADRATQRSCLAAADQVRAPLYRPDAGPRRAGPERGCDPDGGGD